MNTASIDLLEKRMLRSVSLDHGMLSVIGTAHADRVAVYAEPNNPSKLDVKLNGHVRQFDLADVQSLYISTRRGDDRIAVGTLQVSKKDQSVGTDVTLPSRIYAGAGNDNVDVLGGRSHIYAGEGMDTVETSIDASPVTVYGEGGMDEIQTGRGNDLIVGGEGNDILSTNPGNDTIDGGDGNDQIQDTGRFASTPFGNDLLLGGAGNDTIVGADGNDSIDGGAGADTLTGGAGKDVVFGVDAGQALTDPDAADAA